MTLPTPTAEFIECIESTLKLDSKPQLISQSQNTVFEAYLNNIKIALRVTTDKHRTHEQIQSEITLINEIINIVELPNQPIPLKLDQYVLPITYEHDTYYAVAYKYIDGRPLDPKNTYEIMSSSAILARFHRATTGKLKSIDRPTLLHSAIYDISHSTHDQFYDELVAWKSGLQSSLPFYGLIHGDYNFSNLIKSSTYIYLIDFEDSCYGWYAYDIANALYMELFDQRKEQAYVKFSDFFKPFLQSYFSAWPEAKVILDDIPMFVTYRVLMLESWLNGNSAAPAFIKSATTPWKKELLQFVDLYKTKLYPLSKNISSSEMLE